jgi:peroxiredoxin
VRHWPVYLAILLISLAAGVASYQWQRRHAETDEGRAAPAPQFLDTLMLGQRRPDFSLPDTRGVPRSVAEWDDKLLVVNFWATWCPPCLKEIPAFIELQERYAKDGLQFVGIAIDELAAVQEFIAKHHVNYPILVSEDAAIQVAKNFGNLIGALPYTAIVANGGRIVFTKRGELSRAEAEAAIRPHLKP